MDNYSYENKQEIKELLIIYEKLKNGESNSYLEEESFEMLCQYFEDQENLKKALEIINLGVKIYPYSSDLLILKADLLLSLHQIADAEQTLNTSYIYDSINIDYYILKFEIFIRKKKIVEGEEFLNEGLKKFDIEDKLEILEVVVEILEEYFYHDLITLYLFRILEIDNNNEFALKEISFWPQINNLTEEAIDFNLNLINKHPYNHLLWFNLGVYYQHLGLYEKAIESYEFSLAIVDNFEPCLKNISMVFLTLKKYSETINILENLIQKITNPEGLVYAMLALAYYGVKKYFNASQYYKMALSLNKDNIDLFYFYCLSLYKDKKYKESLEQIKKTLFLKNDNSNFQELLGDCYFKLKQYKNSALNYLNCIVINPKNKNGWLKYLKSLALSEQFLNGVEKSSLAMQTFKSDVFLIYKIGFLIKTGNTENAKIMYNNCSNLKISRNIFKIFPELKFIN